MRKLLSDCVWGRKVMICSSCFSIVYIYTQKELASLKSSRNGWGGWTGCGPVGRRKDFPLPNWGLDVDHPHHLPCHPPFLFSNLMLIFRFPRRGCHVEADERITRDIIPDLLSVGEEDHSQSQRKGMFSGMRDSSVTTQINQVLIFSPV